MKNILDIHDLLVLQLRNLYDAESQLKPFLRGLLTHASHASLRVMLKSYINLNNDNFYRLEQVFADLFTEGTGEKNVIIRSMADHTLDLLSTCRTPEVTDAALVLSLQQIMHYKIASYGAVCTYAKILGVYDDGAKLHQVLDGEKKMDRLLVSLADLEIDRNAYNYPKGERTFVIRGNSKLD
ncbi:MAG: ferritin-like metal-binding protein YciE [Cyclobacteriaceae bacterium]|jgi:ferritin-like metal-binding protein YciE